jgi:hypothetical protein
MSAIYNPLHLQFLSTMATNNDDSGARGNGAQNADANDVAERNQGEAQTTVSASSISAASVSRLVDGQPTRSVAKRPLSSGAAEAALKVARPAAASRVADAHAARNAALPAREAAEALSRPVAASRVANVHAARSAVVPIPPSAGAPEVAVPTLTLEQSDNNRLVVDRFWPIRFSRVPRGSLAAHEVLVFEIRAEWLGRRRSSFEYWSHSHLSESVKELFWAVATGIAAAPNSAADACPFEVFLETVFCDAQDAAESDDANGNDPDDADANDAEFVAEHWKQMSGGRVSAAELLAHHYTSASEYEFMRGESGRRVASYRFWIFSHEATSTLSAAIYSVLRDVFEVEHARERRRARNKTEATAGDDCQVLNTPAKFAAAVGHYLGDTSIIENNLSAKDVARVFSAQSYFERCEQRRPDIDVRQRSLSHYYDDVRKLWSFERALPHCVLKVDRQLWHTKRILYMYTPDYQLRDIDPRIAWPLEIGADSAQYHTLAHRFRAARGPFFASAAHEMRARHCSFDLSLSLIDVFDGSDSLRLIDEYVEKTTDRFAFFSPAHRKMNAWAELQRRQNQLRFRRNSSLLDADPLAQFFADATALGVRYSLETCFLLYVASHSTLVGEHALYKRTFRNNILLFGEQRAAGDVRPLTELCETFLIPDTFVSTLPPRHKLSPSASRPYTLAYTDMVVVHEKLFKSPVGGRWLIDGFTSELCVTFGTCDLKHEQLSQNHHVARVPHPTVLSGAMTLTLDESCDIRSDLQHDYRLRQLIRNDVEKLITCGAIAEPDLSVFHDRAKDPLFGVTDDNWFHMRLMLRTLVIMSAIEWLYHARESPCFARAYSPHHLVLLQPKLQDTLDLAQLAVRMYGWTGDALVAAQDRAGGSIRIHESASGKRKVRN